ncbi:histidine phosphatase family protein [Lachnospiraceae bacterium MD335]|nr:histidine phosphatase family protein [Lachnospiraceae bacterium MD335]
MICFYIVRHGQTLLNSLDRAQGWADSPLTDAGKQTAVELGHKLKSIDFDAVYTSDMLRAIQTAELIMEAGEKKGMPIEKDARLREWCLGNMEAENNAVFIKKVADWLGGASFAELNKRLPDVADAIYEHDTTGMAETFQTIEERLKAAFMDMAQRHGVRENSNILVVTHAFAIKTIFHLFAPEQLSKAGKVENAAVSRLISDGGVFSLEPDLKL